MKQKRVLHIIKGLGRGGAERLLVSTIRQHSNAYHFDVVYFLPWKNQLVEDLQRLGCRVTCLSASNVAQMILQLPRLYRLVRANDYDLLHGHLPWSGILARMVGRLSGIPVVYTEHNIFHKYKWPTRFANRFTMGWQHTVIAVSDEVSKVLLASVQPTVPVCTIPNGVDTEEFDRRRFDVLKLKEQFHLPEPAIIVGTVAVFRQQKRLDRWIAIAKDLINFNENLIFVIVGDGLIRSSLEEKASSLIRDGRIRFAGLSETPEQWMACFNIYLMSSDFEGLPVALLEAMSMECVPVVTAVGGIPSVIDQGQDGFMFEPEDLEEAVEKIKTLVNDESLRKRTGFAARQKVEAKFSVIKMVTQLEQIYQRVSIEK